jgi:hypothetical protein
VPAPRAPRRLSGAVLIEQILGGHDHAADAIATLGGLRVDEGLLQRMRLVDSAEPLDRGDFGLTDGTDLGHARAHRTAVQQHRASPALGEPAAEFGAVQREIVAQHVEKWRVGISRHRSLRTVDPETDRHPFTRAARRSRAFIGGHIAAAHTRRRAPGVVMSAAGQQITYPRLDFAEP